MNDMITTVIEITLKKIFKIKDFEINIFYTSLAPVEINVWAPTFIIHIPKFKYLFKRRKIKKYLKNNVIPAGIELIIKGK